MGCSSVSTQQHPRLLQSRDVLAHFGFCSSKPMRGHSPFPGCSWAPHIAVMLLCPITIHALPISPPDHRLLLLRSQLCCCAKVRAFPPAWGHSMARTGSAAVQALSELQPEPYLLRGEAGPCARDALCCPSPLARHHGKQQPCDSVPFPALLGERTAGIQARVFPCFASPCLAFPSLSQRKKQGESP